MVCWAYIGGFSRRKASGQIFVKKGNNVFVWPISEDIDRVSSIVPYYQHPLKEDKMKRLFQ